MRNTAREAIVMLTGNLFCAAINVALFGWISYSLGSLDTHSNPISQFLLYSGAGIVAGMSIACSATFVFFFNKRRLMHKK